MSAKEIPAEDASVTFSVKANAQKWTLTLPLSTTAADLKAKLAAEDMANVPASAQRLIYSGKVLKDHDTLATHNVKEGNTMHLVKTAASNQRQAPSTEASATIPNAGQPQANAGVPTNLASGTGNDPLAGLTGARYAGFAGLPSLESLANPPTPDEMMRRLQDPNFAQQMNEALQNPQMIDMMINMNPQLRAMGPQARQMLQSEQFRRMMTNPEALRSMMDLQNAMGMDPFGGPGRGQEAFPAPGVTNAGEQQSAGQQQEGQPTAPNPPANPFAMFNQMYGVDPANPGPAPAGAGPGQQPYNPFMALLNMRNNFPGQTDANSNNPQQSPLSDPAMQNNPHFQSLMQNPEAALANLAGLYGGNLPGLGGGFGGPADTRPAEERFSTQLRQLNEMGFHDFDRNIQALSRSGGDVNGALEWLFSQGQ